MSESTNSISKGIDTSIKHPVVFIPSLAPMIVGILFQFLAYVVFPMSILGVAYAPNPALVWGGYVITIIVGFIAMLVTVDMANDAASQQPPDFRKSLNVVTSRFGVLLVAAIIAALCAITVILIPVALFIVTIAIVDQTSAGESTSRAFNFVIKNLGEVIVFMILVIVIEAIFGFVFALIPVIGWLLGAVFQWLSVVVFTVAAVHFYRALRQAAPPPPPPPP
jgi:hypothetical protein